ncbi:MAG: hypothetical protein L0Z62_19370 [Gemmataceae bacterium]|nr:hypothetical protein [Gemmataceae bacterium]
MPATKPPGDVDLFRAAGGARDTRQPLQFLADAPLQALDVHAGLLQDRRGQPLLLLGHRQQQVLDRDVLVLEAFRLLGLGCIRRHLLPGGLLAFGGSFPGLAWIGAPQDRRELEGQTKHPRTGQTLRGYDIRSFDRVAQVQRSRNEVEPDEADGTTRIIHRSELLVRWTYKAEMELLLRAAGFARYEVCGGLDRRPLTQETDEMVVLAWAGESC